MPAFVLRRILGAIPLLLGVLTLVFLLLEAVPGDPFAREGGSGVSPQAGERLARAFGADRPAPVRYLEWLRRFLTGDLGFSHSHRAEVGNLVAEAVANTLRLMVPVLFLQFLAGILAGGAALGSRSAWLDRAVTAVAGFLVSFPSYVVALFLTGLFAVRLGWLPVSQMESLDAASLDRFGRTLDTLRHLALPCLSLVLPNAAAVALTVREEMRAHLAGRFILAARARGAPERRVLWRHALSGAALPVVALFGLALPGLVAGSLVVEILFAWPGMGRLAWEAVLSRDTSLVLGCTWAGALLVVGGSLLGDLLGALADPRVREALA